MRRLTAFLVGFAFATALLATISAARAQTADPTIRSLPQRRPPAGSPLRPALPERDGEAESPAAAPPRAGDLRGRLDDPLEATRSPPEPAAATPGDGIVVDGETPRTADGLVADGEPVPLAEDGAATSPDIRLPEDRAAFDVPPAGGDPQLFQIEDLTPLADRRINRLFRFEPYEALGLRVGSFVVFPELEVAGLATSNVLRSPIAQADRALEVRPNLRVVSDWRRHAVELRGAADLSFFDALPSEDNRTYSAEARGRLDITRRANVQALAGRQRSLESRSAIDANRAGSRAEVVVDQALVAFNQRFNRLTVQLRAGITETDVAPTRDATGVVTLNADRDVTVTEEAARASWEFKPTLSAFADVAVNQRRHGALATSDGLTRDSTGERVRLGVGFGSADTRLRGEASLGHGRQRPEAAGLREIDGILVDANVAWRISALTALAVTARTDIADSTAAGVSGVIVRQASVEARHAFRQNVVTTAGLQRTIADYQGIVLQETDTAARLALEWALSRELTLFTRYQHSWFSTTTTGGDYTVDEVRVGVRLRR